MIVEIPQGTRSKLEISRDQPLNPIKQDVKKGKLRYIYDPYPFNYGAFPQTWENPKYRDKSTQCLGDNDPIDVCEISDKPKKTGDILQVKILGIYAMIDEGETDWKVLAIDVNDPLAQKINQHSDIPPEITKKVFNFLRDYKIPDGNPPNIFAFDGVLKELDFAIKIVNETHEQWKQLIDGKIDTNDAISITAISRGAKVIPKEHAEQLLVLRFKYYLRSKY